MNYILKKYITTLIRSNCFENIPLTTKRIKEGYENGVVTNSKIFDELLILENLGIIHIKQAARSRKIYNDRKKWIQWKHRICRYIIDILKPEYFNITTVSETSDWAIKAFVDTENWKFIIRFYGIEESVCINLKSGKDKNQTRLMKFWKQAQDNVNEWCECDKVTKLFAKPSTSINEFFKRFCVELQPFFIEFQKGQFKARFTPIVYSDALKSKEIKNFTFFSGKSNRQQYQSNFDKNGKFLGWHKC